MQNLPFYIKGGTVTVYIGCCTLADYTAVHMLIHIYNSQQKSLRE